MRKKNRVRKKDLKYTVAIEKELRVVNRKEQALQRAAGKSDIPKWKSSLADRVPDKLLNNIQKVFCKAFSIVFENGTGMIEKTFDRDSIREDCQVREFAFQLKADRKSLRKVRGDAGTSNMRNMAMTGVEGMVLGALGIGLPDIVVFVGVLLKGMYEMSLQYGFDYETDREKYFILKLMQTAMLRGEAWEAGNGEIDRLIAGKTEERDWAAEVGRQKDDTAEAFAIDMVLLKFIQGLPIVGIVGGVGNPVYYRKVMKYAEVKYRKRYLLSLAEANRWKRNE